MNKLITVISSLFLILFGSINIYSQDIEVIFHETELSDTLGSEIIFDFEVINISQVNQIVFEVRTLNDLPEEWSSGLCFGQNCFAPHIDSIATTPDFFTPELAPGDTLETSVHIFPWGNHGTANVQIQIGTFLNPGFRITQNFVATSIVTGVNDPDNNINSYSLHQNFPNPFNPQTSISFSLETTSFVNVKIFNLVGEEVASLISRTMDAGMHTVNFDGSNLNSGVYLYRIEASGLNGQIFSSVKKMILMK